MALEGDSKLAEKPSLFHEISKVTGAHGDRPIHFVLFDNFEELVWVGDDEGYVTSYYSPILQKYTCFRVHNTEPVSSLITTDAGIFTLTKTMLRHHIRRGLPKLTFQSPKMRNMRCLLSLDSNRILMGGLQAELIDLDVSSQKDVTELDLKKQSTQCCVLKKHSDFLVCGDPNGVITFLDPTSLKTEHTLDLGHPISDLDVQGNIIAACEGANKNISICDVRTLQPISYSSTTDPIRLKFLPMVSDRLALLGRNGAVHITNPTTRSVEETFTLPMKAEASSCIFDISSTGQAYIIANTLGNIHLLSNIQNDEIKINQLSRNTEFADEPKKLPYVSYDDIMNKYKFKLHKKLPETLDPSVVKFLESLKIETKSEKLQNSTHKQNNNPSRK